MIYEIQPRRVYLSQSGMPLLVKEIARHGQDCSDPYVIFVNLQATPDSPPGITWVLPESIFLSRFREQPELVGHIGTLSDVTLICDQPIPERAAPELRPGQTWCMSTPSPLPNLATMPMEQLVQWYLDLYADDEEL